MSLLFYRRPDCFGREKGSLDESNCASYLERAEAEKSRTPENLQFSEIVKNNTLPPCSLNDFMDYLMYVEYNAECLQFFLWFCDYVERWSRLPKEQKDLAPVCKLETRKTGKQKATHSRTNSLCEQAERMNRILEILETNRDDHTSMPLQGRKPQRNDSDSTNFSYPRGPSPDTDLTEPASGVESLTKSQKLAAQPFRDEVTRIVGHYISNNGPRQLNLESQDRISCILAVKQTTHPSAFLPAFAAAEALLRGRSHPNFIRSTICNCNRPRILFERWIAALFIFLGFAFVAALVLSSMSRFFRIAALPLWLMGFAFLFASRHGICIILHWSYRRNLRPWEQSSDDDLWVENDGSKQLSKLSRSETGDTPTYRIDPLRKPSLQSLGSGNDFDKEPWVEQYHQKSTWKKVFDVSIETQNPDVRRAQNRVVLWAFMWASLIALGLAAGSVFIPSFPLY